MTPAELAAELGVPLSQRNQPDLSAAVPKRFVSLEEATARGMSWYRDGATGACRYGHDNTARRVSNPDICSDCARSKKGLPPVYGKSRTRTYYDEPRRKDPAAPTIAAAAAPTAPLEPSKKEQDFLAALASIGDVDKAAEQTGFSRGQIDARKAVSEVFSEALTKLTDQLGIATKAPPDSEFRWTKKLERALLRSFVDTGLLENARKECGVSASDYFAHLADSPEFAAAIEIARPQAREILRDKAAQAALVGKLDLMKHLEKDIEEDPISNMSVEEMNTRLAQLLKDFDKKGLIFSIYRHRPTGQIFDTRDCDSIPCSDLRCEVDKQGLVTWVPKSVASSDNSDLVSA
jgi:hypothetical protein